MRYLMRKRLKNPAPLEIPERRQVGDVEAIFKARHQNDGADHNDDGGSSGCRTDGGVEGKKKRHFPPARGSDSEL
ncbi:uncharacterized protein C8A04DRAFT_25691 [Dichotomopilus funicola]|uniref:Uncharacterized protein n=1 Tax=Dichotomopilus funicola TaxID=1934379 RepID=A0AAN6ZPV1_9PEZI|nr:hypothetical protein C8A04DRAFT_25691 [Dichotomopilus funicola]